LEHLVVGTGPPVTIFAHGLGGTIESTRPFGSGVGGARVFFHFRGHGASAAPERDWTYAALAAELRAVADQVGATRALGVSMGASAVCALLAQTPDRFERVVLVLPAVIDQPRTDPALLRLEELSRRCEVGDTVGVAELLLAEQPRDVRDRPDVRAWVARQARAIAGSAAARALRTLPYAVPLTDRAQLGAVSAPVLVIGQEDDDAHPERIARELAEAFPHAQLRVLPPGGILWRHRASARRLITEFLGQAAQGSAAR
jgi:pimeloyl-ACP methyl ester carboxylesterase